MENAGFLRVPTLLQRAATRGVRSALLTCKKKTINLLARGADVAVAAEEPPPEFVSRYGAPPGIYSREINYWLWQVAIDLLKNRPDIGCLYVHTTDYPMHEWPPEAAESREHLATLDGLLGEARDAAPDAAFLLTADHGMNYKRRCWDLARALCRPRPAVAVRPLGRARPLRQAPPHLRRHGLGLAESAGGRAGGDGAFCTAWKGSRTCCRAPRRPSGSA